MAAACAADIRDKETELTRPRSSAGAHSRTIALAATIATAAPNPIPSVATIATIAAGKAASSRMHAPTTPIPAAIRISLSSSRAIRSIVLWFIKIAPASVPIAVIDPIAP
jgi:hypothetical protein